MDLVVQFFRKESTKKILSFILLIVIIYAFRPLLNVFLLTFLFTYIVYNLQNGIKRRLGRYVKINELVLTIILYVIFFVILSLMISIYIPKVIFQCKDIFEELLKFDLESFSNNFLNNFSPKVKAYIEPLYSQVDLSGLSKDGLNILTKFLSHIGKVSLNVLFALILSLFFMLEMEKVKNFTRKFKESKLSWFYKYINQFGKSFVNSFGKVIQAQIMIAAVNSVLSIIGLKILGFPQLLGLGVMIFILSLIPVAGVIISLFPLSIIAFNIGGVNKIVWVLIMIAALHALESYVLNPKFMSDKTKLPIFFVFVILMVSEHFMGVWGLIIGLPLFIFILDLLNVNYNDEEELVEK